MGSRGRDPTILGLTQENVKVIQFCKDEIPEMYWKNIKNETKPLAQITHYIEISDNRSARTVFLNRQANELFYLR